MKSKHPPCCTIAPVPHLYSDECSCLGPSQSHNLLFFLSPPFHRENNFIKDFPQLADGLLVIPLPVEEQCRGVLSEPLPDLQLLTGKTYMLGPSQPLVSGIKERV